MPYVSVIYVHVFLGQRRAGYQNPFSASHPQCSAEKLGVKQRLMWAYIQYLPHKGILCLFMCTCILSSHKCDSFFTERMFTTMLIMNQKEKLVGIPLSTDMSSWGSSAERSNFGLFKQNIVFFFLMLNAKTAFVFVFFNFFRIDLLEESKKCRKQRLLYKCYTGKKFRRALPWKQ